MKTKILLVFLFLISILNSNLFSQTYKTGFDNMTEQSGWAQYRVGFDDPFYEWEYTTFETLTNPNCLLHNYPVGGTEVTDDWFVSPVFDFSEGGMIDSVWHRFSGFGLPLAGDTVAIYLINGSADPELATSKTMLFNYADTSYMNDGVWTLNTNIDVPNTDGDSYIAFRYKTIVNWLDVRFDNLTITSNISIGTNQVVLDPHLIDVFPNPSNNDFNITIDENLKVNSIVLYDFQGKIINTFPKNHKTLNINNLNEGAYILNIQTDEGILSKKLIKN